ncbi:MAG: flagellar hook-associated protein FlgL [Abditibacteriales bacterium]|nr:flagellar hook-associated protein FlgL [Abditibacteriales bacterium]MDW8364565.1 flagellar hook-associated protein FlgL [Abditibacteriales bacterium]
MRVSTQGVTDRVMFELNLHLERLQRLQVQLSSGKRLTRASDDPAGAAAALDLRAILGQVEQYQRNGEDALGFARATESALGEASNLLRQARTLTIAGAKDSLGQGERTATAMQVRNLRDALLRVANAEYDGRSIFSGTRTDIKPFSLAGDGSANYAGNSEDIVRQVGKDFQQTVNVPGDEAFNVNGSVAGVADAFKLLTDIADDIENGNVTRLSDTRLREMDALLQHVLGLRADMGARLNTLEMTKNMMLNTQTNLREQLANTEEVDLSAVVTQLQTEELTYRAALAAASRIVPQSLLDFLR